MHRSRHNVKLNKRGETGRLVGGEDSECKKNDFEVNLMMNWPPVKVIVEL
jgi:hypothetical protein